MIRLITPVCIAQIGVFFLDKFEINQGDHSLAYVFGHNKVMKKQSHLRRHLCR
jgi:hypothetical protein